MPEWLDGQQLEGTQVPDFGCGSGILAIAALLLGAREAIGTDIDVQAIEASRDNAQRNGIADERLALYLPEQMPAMQADVPSPTSWPARWSRWPRNCPAWFAPEACWPCPASLPSRATK